MGLRSGVVVVVVDDDVVVVVVVVQVCIVFTDGDPTSPSEKARVPAASKAWAGIGALVFAVGIGGQISEEGKRVGSGSGQGQGQGQGQDSGFRIQGQGQGRVRSGQE